MMKKKIQSPGWLPDESKNAIETLWEALPENDKNSLKKLVDKIPSRSNLWKLLVKLASNQAKFTVGQKTQVAIVGPTNVGKSTLYNQFVIGKENFAEVSPVPGTTRTNQEGGAGLFSVIDTPGADAIGKSGEEERDKAFQAAKEAEFLVIIFDAIQGIKKTEQELFETLTELKIPYIVVLNKIDLVGKNLNQVLLTAAENLHLEPEKIIPISAKNSQNLAKILLAIASEEPEILAALGHSLPQYRWQLAWRVIVSSASLSGVIALTPLPLIDFIPLIINQSSMVLSIARIYNYQIDKTRARELVVAFGLGFLGRTLFYEMSKFGGMPGWILAAVIAASTTVAMGYAAVAWFDKGERLTRKRMSELTWKVSHILLDAIKGSRDRRKLNERITTTLEQSELGTEQAIIESLSPETPIL